MGSNSVVNPIGHNFLGTGGTVVNRPLSALGTGGLSEFTQKNPFGVPVNNPLAQYFGNSGSSTPQIGGSNTFQLDPNQVSANQSAITGLGQSQYNQTQQAIKSAGDQAQKFAAQTFQQELPSIAEDYNAGHVLNGTGYQQEVARQQANLANQVAMQQAQQSLQSTGALQGTQTAALQRGLGLEDFINQANVAKTIGAQMAPQPPTSKAQTGTLLQGAGAVAPLVKAIAK